MKDGVVGRDLLERLPAIRLSPAPVRRRYRPCLTEAEIVGFISSKNMERRDLDPGQRAILAVHIARDAENALNGTPGQRAIAAVRGLEIETKRRDGRLRFNEQVTRQFHIGDGTVAQAIKVIDNDPTLAGQVMAGDVSLNEAYRPSCAAITMRRSSTANLCPMCRVPYA